MSDSSSSQSAMRRALDRCNGPPRCPCGGEPSARSSLPSSPSRSRSTDLGGASAGESSNNSSSGSESEGHSDSNVPLALSENEWSDLGIVRIHKCSHGRHAVLKRAWGGRHNGRCFLACPIKDEAERCQFLEWCEEPWPERVQLAFKKLWRELNLTRHIESEAHDQLIEVLKINEEARKKEKLKEDVTHTKQVAEQVCGTYQHKAAYALVDKSKLMHLVYCLLGVIAFQAAVLFVVVKK